MICITRDKFAIPQHLNIRILYSPNPSISSFEPIPDEAIWHALVEAKALATRFTPQNGSTTNTLLVVAVPRMKRVNGASIQDLSCIISQATGKSEPDLDLSRKYEWIDLDWVMEESQHGFGERLFLTPLHP